MSDRLSDAKRALLAKRLQGARGAVVAPPEAPAVARRPASAPLRLTAGQRRLWTLHRLDPASAAYTMTMGVRLRGPLDVSRLEAALGDVVARHEVLRLRVEAIAGRPQPRIEPAGPVEILTTAVEGPDAAACLDAALGQATAFARTPFDLAADAPLRARVWRLGDHDALLVLAVHHLVADEWSLGVLWRELAARYADPATALPDLPVQVADLAHMEHERPRDDGALAYWTARLADLPEAELAADRHRSSAPSRPGALRTRPLPDGLADRLRTLAANEGVTLFMLAVAAVQTLLHRHTSQDDLAVGAPVTTRTHAEMQRLVGFFLDTVVLRADLAGDPPFRDVLAQARTSVLEAFAHAGAPFERVVDALRVPRRPGRTPLFQTMVVLETAPALAPLGDFEVEAVRIPTGAAKFDLTVFLTEAGDALSLTAEHATDVFETATVDCLLAHLETLLADAVEAPDTPVSCLRLASGAEQATLREFAQTAPPVPIPDGGVVTQIEAHARETPDAVAVVTAGERMTYGDLWAASERLAAHLRTLGVGPDTRVGLCVPRSAKLIAGLVGILRAGGAYVPLDPAVPAERRQRMLDDADAQVLVTTDASDLEAATVVDLAQTLPEAPALDAAPGLDDLAYVLYTSGSTGEPKGVHVTHRTLAHSTEARRAVYDAPPEHFLLLSSVAFDSSVAGLFWTLTSGGTLVLPPDRIEQDLAAFAALVEAESVTHTLCLPSLWRLVISRAPATTLASLRCVVVAGEAMPPGLAVEHAEHVPAAALFNEYGPTEATVWTTVYRVPNAIEAMRTPIGRPIPGTRATVRDAHGNLAPIGVAGELCLGGANVAAGYLGRPDLTDAAFVPDPDVPGARMYCTGDRARWREDGTLDLLGRLDHQVKIRGQRIELGEVEVRLREHAGVRDAAAVLRTAGEEPPRLVAAVEAAASVTPRDLVQGLRSRLPAAMVPSRIAIVDALPRTAAGKVDRTALVLPDDTAETREAVMPATPVETALLAIWQDVLDRPGLGVEDDFFEVGGDSILSIQVLARAAEAGLSMATGHLFAHPTVRGLARAIEADGAEAHLVPLAPSGTRPPLFILHGWGGKLFAYVDLAKRLGDDQPVYGIQDIDRADPADRFPTFDAMATHYVDVIREQQPHGPYALLGFSLGGTLAFAIASKLRARGEAVARVFILDTTPVNLPRRVYARVLLPFLKQRARHHLSALVRSPTRALSTLRRLAGTFRSEFRPPRDETEAPAPAVLDVEAGMDYYRALLYYYTPRPCAMPITLVESSFALERYDAVAAWRFLAGPDVRAVAVETDSHDDLLLGIAHNEVPAIVRDELERLHRDRGEA